jgi:putative NIF3 family GTP cyclohydrolase 1 type 2
MLNSENNLLKNGSSQAISLQSLANFLDEFFAVEEYDSDQNGIYRPSNRPIKRLGIALEPEMGLTDWANTDKLDALFLHRPWRLQIDELLPDVGILSYHLAFDERLTLGFNPRLANALGLKKLEVLGHKEGRAIGMLGEAVSHKFQTLCDRVEAIFGGCEQIRLPAQNTVRRVAVVGAMNDALVREAADRVAQVYITGQWRQPGELAVTETGIGVIAIGHRRAENWGLRDLAAILRERWVGLEVLLYSNRSKD